VSKDLSEHEQIYQSLNKTLSDVFRVIKFLIWPITILFVIVIIIWGVDIYKLRNELENIKNSLELSKKEIELSEREANLQARESLVALTKKLATIDSTFNVLELEYHKALNESKNQLISLQHNTENFEKFSTTIQNNIDKALVEYENIQRKYVSEIEYAAKGAELRKEDMDKLYLENRKLLLQLTSILTDFNTYINKKASHAIVTDEYDVQKVEELNQKLNKEITTFQRELEKHQ